MAKTYTPKQIIKLLITHGFRLKRKKGSHFIFQHPQTKKRVVVPFHTKDLPKGTLHAILKMIRKKSHTPRTELEKEIFLLRSALISIFGKDKEGGYKAEFAEDILKAVKEKPTHTFINRRAFLAQLEKA